MLRTITSHAARRQRQQPQQRSAGRIRTSSVVGGGLIHGHSITSSTTISSSTSLLSMPLSCCLPCSDDADDRHHNGVNSRQFHSLSISSYPSSPLPSSSTSLLSNTRINAAATTIPPSHQQPSTTSITIQKRHKVFVSKHNNTLNLTPQSITSYITAHLPHLNPNSLDNHNGDFRITQSHVIMKECPFCPKPTNGKADNFYKVYIAIGGGAYFCHRCGAKGSWYDFKSEVGGFAVDAAGSGNAWSHNSNGGGGNGNNNNNASNGGGGGGQPWNWNTANNNNQGMGYLSTKQLITNPHGNGHAANNNNNNGNHNNGNNNKQKVELLPMPPKKLNSIYTAKLFDPSNTPTNNPKEHAALEYLTQTRGLHRSVLRKYGVGCASYNFPDKNATNGISYVASMCVTFPWLMRAGEVAEQEELRGAKYVWKTAEDEKKDTENGRKKVGRAGPEKSREIIGKNKKRPSEMTALERYHHRMEKKAAKLLQEDEATPIEQQQQQEQELTPEDTESLYGPYIPRRIKVRSTTNKSNQRLDPPGGGFGLFGWHTIPQNASSIIITEGEFDAMAVYQATGRPAVSLPNGCRSLRQ